jgi:hypothetical protein
VLELGADQVTAEDLHLLVLTGLIGAFGIDRDQDAAQQGSEVPGVAALDDPAIDPITAVRSVAATVV